VSPKNKGKFGQGKADPDVTQPDEFISGVDRVLRALKPHAIKLAIFFGVITVVVVSFTTYRWWGQRKASGATSLYAKAVALGTVEITDTPPEPNAKMPPDPRGLPTHFATRAERAIAVLAAVDELQSEYGSTDVAKQADVIAADALLDAGKYAEAAERYQTYIDHGGPEEIVTAAREGYGYALEAMAEAEKDTKDQQAGLEKALKAFEAMQPDEEGTGRDEALFHQARVLVGLGRNDEAVKRFEQILSAHPDSGLRGDVEMRLVALGAGGTKASAPSPDPDKDQETAPSPAPDAEKKPN
jgi:tetratricopeptide (TPR) repeat protein